MMTKKPKTWVSWDPQLVRSWYSSIAPPSNVPLRPVPRHTSNFRNGKRHGIFQQKKSNKQTKTYTQMSTKLGGLLYWLKWNWNLIQVYFMSSWPQIHRLLMIVGIFWSKISIRKSLHDWNFHRLLDSDLSTLNDTLSTQEKHRQKSAGTNSSPAMSSSLIWGRVELLVPWYRIKMNPGLSWKDFWLISAVCFCMSSSCRRASIWHQFRG